MYMNLHYLYLKELQKIALNIVKINIVSTAFHEEHRASISNVLSLDAIDFLSSSPIGGKPHININTTAIYVDISPSTVKTVVEAVELASQYQGTESDEKESNLERLWEINDVRSSEATYLDAPPEDVLSAGSSVLGRNRENTYEKGFLSKKDTHFTVFFCPEGEISHSVRDVTSVVVDKNPNEHDLVPGVNVVAMYPAVGYKVGRVIGIWAAEQTSRKEDQLIHEWEIACEDDAHETKYLIRFYHDGTDFYLTRSSIRLLPLPLRGAVPGVGAGVFARYRDGSYYLGIVKAVKGFQTEVHLKDMNAKVSLDHDDTAALVLNLAPQEAQVKPRYKVIAKRSDSEKGFHPGKVLSITGETGCRTYHIKFEDGTTNEVTLSELRLMPKAPYDALPAVGSYVYSRISKESPVYEKAIVVQRGQRLLIDHLSGRKISHAIENISFVARNIVPLNSSLHVGQLVIGQVDEEDEMTMTMGKIKEIIIIKQVKKYSVEFKDGLAKILPASRIRLLSTYGDAEENNEGTGAVQIRKEQLVVEVEKISLKIHGSLGDALTPLLSVRSKVSAQVSDWTTNIEGVVNLSLQSSYYNDQLDEWEPLIEPIITWNQVRDWHLVLNYSKQSNDNTKSHSNSEADDLLQEPITSLRLTSGDRLNVTLTDKVTSMLEHLWKTYGSGILSTESESYTHYKNQYTIYNRLGLPLMIQTNKFLQDKNAEEKIILNSFGEAELDCITCGNYKSSTSTGTRTSPALSVQVQGYQEIKHIVVKRRKVSLYNLLPLDVLQGDPFCIVVEVQVSEGRRSVTFRSPLVFRNKFPLPLQIKYISDEEDLIELEQVEPNYELAIPLLPAYRSKLFIAPCLSGYHHSSESFDWKAVKMQRSNSTMECKAVEEGCESFYIRTDIEMATYTSVHGMMDGVPRYIVNCYPPILLHNYLPYTVVYRSKGREIRLEGGEISPLYSVSVEDRPVIEIVIEEYTGLSWTGSFIISGPREEVSRFDNFLLRSTNDNANMELGIFQWYAGTLNLTPYSPYWMVNKTGLSLSYRGTSDESIRQHSQSHVSPIMFQVKGKKKVARLSTDGCNWSKEISLDAVGSDCCLDLVDKHGSKFEIAVRIKLSKLAVTKIVTFAPLRMISNTSKQTILLLEENKSGCHTVNANETMPYWPIQTPPQNLQISINGYESARFNPEVGKTLLLRFQNEVGAICVTYHENASSSLLTFDNYFHGSAPVRLENMCIGTNTIMSYQQTGFATGHGLLYGKSVLYTWDDPTQEHELVCGVAEYDDSATTIQLDQDGFGCVKTVENIVYWVSFLDGVQRVLLFTDTFKEAYYASSKGQMVRPSLEVSVNIESVGISLVNSEKRLELAYLSISKSPILWQYVLKKRTRLIDAELAEALEDWYNEFKKNNINGTMSRVNVGNIEVDYERMLITKPEKTKIQRIYRCGVEIKTDLFANRVSISGSINNLQVDCHIPGCTFPTLVHIVQPPDSVVKENALKPFVHFSFIGKYGNKNNINEITYFKVLVQEIDVRMDRLFLDALIAFVTPQSRDLTEKEKYRADTLHVERSLESSPEYQSAKQERRYLFTFLHVSPLRIHLSFSNVVLEKGTDTNASVGGGILLQSIGLVFTEIQDVDIKLACYEVNSSLLALSQLTTKVMKHYMSQAIKQLYVLVLGLDVLGNPLELIAGAGQGAKNFFYEPYQGLIQGPGEFAEGLGNGIRSLLGGTVGGVSGAVSKITGTVGKGLAKLTLDDDYQQRRRQRMNDRPTNVGQGLVKGGKGLVKGIVFGVTGIVTKPIQGAMDDGAEGLIKGFGKGLIGVVARPAGGVADLASNTFEGIRSTTTGVEAITKVRESRAFYADNILQSYNPQEAKCHKVFNKTDKGFWAKTDAYMRHIYPVDGHNYLILTNRRILYVKYSDVFNEWVSDWNLVFGDIKGEPVVDGDSLTFYLQIKETRVFKKDVTFRKVILPDGNFVPWFLDKLEDMKLL